MSRIEKKVKELKIMNDREGWKEPKKITVTVRLHPFSVFCLDELLKEIGGNRTSICQEMISEGVVDGLAALGHDLESLKKRYFDQAGQGIFVEGMCLDAEESQRFLKDPEKFGVPVHHMTPEEEAAYIAEGPHSQEEADAMEKEKIKNV